MMHALQQNSTVPRHNQEPLSPSRGLIVPESPALAEQRRADLLRSLQSDPASLQHDDLLALGRSVLRGELSVVELRTIRDSLARLSGMQQAQLAQGMGGDPNARLSAHAHAEIGNLPADTQAEISNLRRALVPGLLGMLQSDAFVRREQATRGLVCLGMDIRENLEALPRARGTEFSERIDLVLTRIAENHGAALARRATMGTQEERLAARLERNGGFFPRSGGTGRIDFAAALDSVYRARVFANIVEGLQSGDEQRRAHANMLLHEQTNGGSQINYLITGGDRYGDIRALSQASEMLTALFQQYSNPAASPEVRAQILTTLRPITASNPEFVSLHLAQYLREMAADSPQAAHAVTLQQELAMQNVHNRMNGFVAPRLPLGVPPIRPAPGRAGDE